MSDRTRPAAPAAPAASRSAIDDLMAEHQAGRLEFVQTRDDGTLVLRTPTGRTRGHDEEWMREWLDGWRTGHLAVGGAPPHIDPALASVRSVLVNPSVSDQVRRNIWYRREERNLSVTDVADLVGIGRKPAAEALRFGKPSSLAMAAAVGLDPNVSLDLAAADPDGPVLLAGPQPEPWQMRSVRVLAWAHEAGVLVWQDPGEVNQVMAAQQFRIAVPGDGEHVVPAISLLVWIGGLLDAQASRTGFLLADAADQVDRLAYSGAPNVIRH